ncbi:MAG TPA: putative porin [Bacteroidales bacterium]|jgi:hypothetical protein|nr:putative porin [Bacteroidales bacterium]
MLIHTNTRFKCIVSLIIFLLIPGIHNAQNITRPNSNDTTSPKIDSTQTIISLEDKLINPNDSTLSATDSLKVIYFKGSIEKLKLNRFNFIDTNTYHFQQFDPLHINNRLYSTLSNIGLAAKNLVYSPTLTTDYYLGSSVFTRYLYHNKNVKYYYPIVPYTEIRYVMATNREQNLNVIFTREIFNGFTIGLDYALNYSPSNKSPYQRSGVNDQRVFFTSQYYTKNKRYGLIANYLRNKIVAEENGGIKYDSIFEDNIESDRRVIPVNLMKAENMVKQSGFFIEQYFNILPPIRTSDSIKKRKIDPGSISYSFRYRRNQMIYSDDDTLTPFYIGHDIPLDSVSTYDSLFQSEIQNTIKWSNIGYHENPKDKIFYIYLGATHNFIKQMLPHDSVASNISQLTPFGGIAFNFGRSFHLSVDVNYVFGNYNQNDYSVDAILNQYLGNELRNIGSLKFGLNLTNRTPNWYYNNYQSNYYRWSNNLKKEKHLILTGSYTYKQFSVGAKFYTIENYTYLNDSVRPQQIEKGETLLELFAEGTIPMNKFGINTRIVYQTTSQPNIIRVPSLSGVVDIYLRSPIFKSAAVLQTGFQVTYFSEYYADAYMPELRLFYLQNNKKIGNYPYIDFYVTLMVKRARLFFKVAHLNSYFGDYRYYLAPNYPARDSRFCFGVSWRFHD